MHEQSNLRDARNNVTKQIQKGYLHGGTHVHSLPAFFSLPDDVDFHDFSVNVPFIVNEPGDFFVIGSIQLFLSNASEFHFHDTPLLRYDIANAAEGRIVSFQEPADIKDVSYGVTLAIYVVSGIAGLLILFFLCEVIRHRKTQIMKLSQGDFLIALLVAALWATASAWLWNPTISDLVCTLSAPMVFIPIQLIYAIIIGRVWRTQQVLSPLLQEIYETRLSTSFSRFINCLACIKSTRSLKTTITSRQLATVVFWLTLPQVIIQILAVILQPQQIMISYTEDASKGRQYCGSPGVPNWFSLTDWGFYLILLMNLFLLIAASSSRRLPSLFNELQIILAMSMANVLVLLVGFSILVVTNGPATAPDIEYIIWVVVLLSITMNSSIRLVYPKLRMVWNGETVLVSKLVSDHKRIMASKSKDSSQGNGSSGETGEVLGFRKKLLANVTGFSFRGKAAAQPKNSNTVGDSMFSPQLWPPPEETDKTDVDLEALSPDSTSSRGLGDSLAVIQREAAQKFQRPSLPDNDLLQQDSLEVIQEEARECQRVGMLDNNLPLPEIEEAPQDWRYQLKLSKKSNSRKVILGDLETPSRTLVVPMVRLQEKLIAINNRVTTGVGVAHEEWEALREMTVKLGNKFYNDVEFEWEADPLTTNIA